MDLQHERDIEQLRRIAQAQDVQIRHLLQVLQRKCDELAELKGHEGELQQTLELLERMQAREQQAGAVPPAAERPRLQRPGHGPTEQTELTTVTEVYELDEADRVCSSCGGTLEVLEGQDDETEMVDVVQAQYRLVTVKARKYRCRCGGCIESALGPERCIKGGRYSLAFGAKVVTDKYLDHLPLDRQVRILGRHGLKVTSQTLWDQALAIATELKPAYEALLSRVLSQPVIGLDQTGWPRLTSKKSKDRKPWQMWCLTGRDVVYHRICEDKSAATFTELVGDYQGVIVCDALGTHAAGAREGPGITLANCWAHVQRRFAAAEADYPEARLMLDWIGELYAIDRKADSDAHRGELRETESRAVLDHMHQWLTTRPALKTTSIGTAIRYTLGCWPRLTRFAEHPDIWLDNNLTERSLRGPVVGRKNHYGSKSERGTAVAARLYSLLETAKLIGLDPARYIVEAVTAARQARVLLPHDLRG